MSTDNNVSISLNIIESTFISNMNAADGCFDLYSGDINIIDSTFDSNEGHAFSVIILHVRNSGNLNINSSVFIRNKEISQFVPTTLPKGLFNMKKG
eukprot:762328_1